MTNTTESPQVSLERFFETAHAFHRTAALKAAIELDVFTAIGQGADTADVLAQRCNASERGMRILCDYLTVIGFLTKTGNRFALTQDSAIFLDGHSPGYVGAALEFLLAPTQTEAFRDLAAVVRKGGTIMRDEGVVAPEHPVWIQFARAMAPLMALPAESLANLLASGLAEKWKVLDIAAGHGLYGIAVAKQNRNANVFAVDWASVLTVAEENARAAGVKDRYHALPGSAFSVDYGAGYDLALLTNFLHHFDAATCQKLLRKVYAALKPGGRAAILEFIPNEDRISPPVPAQFSLMMLATTPGGDAYTFSQYEGILRDVGFVESELHPLPPTYFRAVIATK
jgi:ubiquinone/menaquinone biosynthesis C-methylase UbiE